MNSKLIRDNKIIHEFPFAIQEIRELDDRYIIVLRVPQDKIYNENVFCVSKEGKMLWQIEKRDLMREKSPYIGTAYDKKELIIYNLYSFEMRVDINTGRILSTEFSK